MKLKPIAAAFALLGAAPAHALLFELPNGIRANVDTTLNVYTQVLDGSLRAAVDKIGSELFTIVQCQEDSQAPVG